MDKQVSVDSEKLHIGGVHFFYYSGVHTVRRNDRKIVTTNQVSEPARLRMKTFYDAINRQSHHPAPYLRQGFWLLQ